jgi:hypothetical protein
VSYVTRSCAKRERNCGVIIGGYTFELELENPEDLADTLIRKAVWDLRGLPEPFFINE